MIKGIITGPTATGKSEIGIRLAKANKFEIISADSCQIYSDLVIGTDQIPKSEQQQVPHHLMGTVDGDKEYSAYSFSRDVFALTNGIPQKNFLLVGGTGFYIKSLFRHIDNGHNEKCSEIDELVDTKVKQQGVFGIYEELKKKYPYNMGKIHPNDGYRIIKALKTHLQTGNCVRLSSRGKLESSNINFPIFVISRPREEIYQRINERVDKMIRKGWVKETKDILEKYQGSSVPCLRALGYKFLQGFLSGSLSLEQAIECIKQKTRNYAKRQITYFKTQLPNAKTIQYEDFLTELGDLQWSWDRLVKKWH